MVAHTEAPPVTDAFAALLNEKLQEWPSYGSRACIQTATEDYTFLLERNKRLEVLSSLLVSRSNATQNVFSIGT